MSSISWMSERSLFGSLNPGESITVTSRKFLRQIFVVTAFELFPDTKPFDSSNFIYWSFSWYLLIAFPKVLFPFPISPNRKITGFTFLFLKNLISLFSFPISLKISTKSTKNSSLSECYFSSIDSIFALRVLTWKGAAWIFSAVNFSSSSGPP